VVLSRAGFPNYDGMAEDKPLSIFAIETTTAAFRLVHSSPGRARTSHK
jgi:hypothetical protein